METTTTNNKEKAILDRFLIISALLLYFVGDLVTTWYGFHNGARESNTILAPLGFSGIVAAKVAFGILIFCLVNHFDKKGYERASGAILGAAIGVGLITVLMNLGVLYALH